MATAQPLPDTVCKEAIIRGIPSGVSDCHLLNFVECKLLDCLIEELQFKKQGVAHVFFQETVDLREVQTKAEKVPLEGCLLRIEPLDQRGAVLIHNPYPRTSTNSFKFYLSNKKRSGGSNVQDIRRDENNRFLIAFYHTREEAELVAKKSHVLEQQKLQLQFFDPNFDEPPCLDESQSSTPSAEQKSSASVPSDSNFPPAENATVAPLDSIKFERLAKSQEPTVPERERKHITRNVQGLCEVYQRVLDAFICSSPKHQLNIQVEMENDGMKVLGEESDVEKAETLIRRLCEHQKSSEYLNKVAVVFSGWADVFDKIQTDIESGKSSLVIQEGPFGVEEYKVLLNQSGQFLSFEDFLKRYMYLKIVPVKSKEVEELLETITWESFRESDMDEVFGNRVTLIYNKEGRCIDVIGDVQSLDSAVDSVKQFITNTPDERQFTLHTTERDFLQKFWLRGLPSTQCGAGVEYAEVTLESCTLKISGSRAGVRKEAKKLETFRKNFKCKRAILAHPKLATLKNPELWMELVSNTVQENKCLITELPDPQVSDADEENDDWGQWAAAVIHSFTLPGQSLELHVVEGHTEDLKVDAVVLFQENTLQQPLVPHAQGAHPKVYSGDQEHRALLQQKEGVRVIQPGARPGKAVLEVSPHFYFPHHAKPSWDRSVERLIADLFTVCDRYHFCSMALPVFGVDVSEGSKPKPVDVAARTLTKSITEIWCHKERSEGHKRSGGSGLKHVFLCSPRAACLHALTYALQDDLAWILASPTRHSFSFLASDVPAPASNVLPGDFIEIHKDDISRAQADAIVVPCDIDIDLELHKSQVTKSLMRGGHEVQSSLQKGEASFSSYNFFSHDNQIDERNEELAENGIVMGRAGALRAQRIFYVFLPPWGPKAKQMLTESVQKSLQAAAEKKYSSVALAPLGVGKLNYPARFAARTALCAVSDFMATVPTSLRKVHFVVFDQTTWEVYQEEYWRWQKQLVLYGSGGSLPSSHAARGGGPPPIKYPYHTVPGYTPHAQPWGPASLPSPTHHSAWAPRTRPPPGKYPSSMKIGNIKLQIKIGDITREKFDAIVNSTNNEFDFKKGAVSRAIEKCASDILVRLCHEKKNEKEMKNSGVVVTSAPGMPYCECIVHMDLERYRQKPKETVLKCLTSLLNKCPSTHTVAFPALGAGPNRSRGAELVVKSMKEALHELKKPKNLREVCIVANTSDLFQQLMAFLDLPAPPRQASPAPTNSPRQSSGPRPQTLGAAASSSSAPSSSPVLVSKVPRSRWGDPNTLSLFVFSDREEDWHKACSRLAQELESILGPVKNKPARAGDGRSGPSNRAEYPQLGCFYFGDYWFW